MHRGRYRDLSCHWRSRLSFLLTHALAMPESEPRTRVSGHGPLSTTACRIEEFIRALTRAYARGSVWQAWEVLA